jgi:mRNA interferase RelE/StbE
MRVEFLTKFNKDLDRISLPFVRKSIIKVIQQVESARSLADVPNSKKLSGYKSAYRIRIGEYRIGIFVVGDLVQFGRVVNRKDIYKVFP